MKNGAEKHAESAPKGSPAIFGRNGGIAVVGARKPILFRKFGYFGSLNYTKFAFCIIACIEGRWVVNRFSSVPVSKSGVFVIPKITATALWQ